MESDLFALVIVPGMGAKEEEVLAAIQRLSTSSCSPHNREVIVKYDKKLCSNGIGFARRKKMVDMLRWWAEQLGVDFERATKEDMERVSDDLKTNAILGQNKQQMSTGTKNNYIFAVRQFYKYLEGDDEDFPDKVRKVKPLQMQASLISEDGTTKTQIYSVEEIHRMIQMAKSPRDKCLIALSYDSGARLDEVSSLRMGHVKEGSPYYKVFLHGSKTSGKNPVAQRWVSVYFAVPYIREYLKTHPFKPAQKEKPFWVSYDAIQDNMNEPITYEGFKSIFYRIMRGAKITNRRFHDLRHTKCTHLLRLGMQETKVKKSMGWSVNSKQLGRYAHLVDEDVDEELCKLYGLPFTKKSTDDIPVPVKCPTCGEINEPNNELCKRCDKPLSAAAINNELAKKRYWGEKNAKEMSKLKTDMDKMHKFMGVMAEELNRQQKFANDNEPDPEIKKLGKQVAIDWESFVKGNFTKKAAKK